MTQFYEVKRGSTGVHIFYFAPKRKLWVLIRTASVKQLEHIPTSYALRKNKKNIVLFLAKDFVVVDVFFLQQKIAVY